MFQKFQVCLNDCQNTCNKARTDSSNRKKWCYHECGNVIFGKFSFMVKMRKDNPGPFPQRYVYPTTPGKNKFSLSLDCHYWQLNVAAV